jgi:hypothetical protein
MLNNSNKCFLAKLSRFPFSFMPVKWMDFCLNFQKSSHLKTFIWQPEKIMNSRCTGYSHATTAQTVSRLLLSFPSCQPGWDEKKVSKHACVGGEKSRQNNACLDGSRASTRRAIPRPIGRHRLADGDALFCRANALLF